MYKERAKLMGRYTEDTNYQPSGTEIEEAYDYLSYCLKCKNRIRWYDFFEHGIVGNCHKVSCGTTIRILLLPIRCIYYFFRLVIFLALSPVILFNMIICKYIEFRVEKKK